MPAQRRIQPALGKEDIARGLDLLEQLEARKDVLLRLGGAQRVVQVAQRLEHPGLMLAIRRAFQALEERISSRRIG